MKLKIDYWCIFLIFYALFIPFGGLFLKIGGKLNVFFLLMGGSLVYFFWLFFKKKKKQLDFSVLGNYIKCFKLFWMLIGIVLLLSSIKFAYLLFNLQNLDYNFSFVFRQGYFFFVIPIGILLFRQIASTDKLEKLSKISIYLYTFLLLTLIVFKVPFTDGITYSEGLLIMTTFIFYRFNKPLGFILSLLSVAFLTSDQSSFLLGYIVIFGTMTLSIFNISKLKLNYAHVKKLSLLLGIAILTIVVAVLLNIDKFEQLLASDANALWRWQYWKNEMVTLAKTYGLGVGYGTAYASDNIWWTINNPNCFATANDSFSIPQKLVLFVVPQHSSLINAFYRLGIFGGFLFLTLNIYPIMLALKAICKSIGKERDILLWSVTNYIASIFIIFLNPGIVSPRFMFSYLFMYAINLGLAYKTLLKVKQKEILAIEEIKTIGKNNEGEIYQ